MQLKTNSHVCFDRLYVCPLTDLAAAAAVADDLRANPIEMRPRALGLNQS